MTRGLRARCWPTHHQEELLRAALRPEREAVAAWQRWRDAVPFDDVDPGAFRLLPLAYRNLPTEHLDDPTLPRLKGIYRQSWYRNQRHFMHLRRVLAALHEEGIPSLIVRGVALSRLYYADDGTRPMLDTDVSVRAGDFARAVRVLERLHWRPSRPIRASPPPHRGSWPFQHEDGSHLGLHWHVFNACLAPDADDDLWAVAHRMSFNGVPTRVLAPADELLLTLAHGMHANAIPSIRWVADAALIVSTAGDRLDWARFLDQAAGRRLMPFAAVALPYLHRAFDVPVPAPVLTRLSRHRPTLAVRLDVACRMGWDPLSGLGRMWFGYLRSLEGTDRWPTLPGFVRYLRALWMVESVSDLWRTTRQKVVTRLAPPLAAHTSK